jgi:hypothetical protein
MFLNSTVFHHPPCPGFSFHTLNSLINEHKPNHDPYDCHLQKTHTLAERHCNWKQPPKRLEHHLFTPSSYNYVFCPTNLGHLDNTLRQDCNVLLTVLMNPNWWVGWNTNLLPQSHAWNFPAFRAVGILFAEKFQLNIGSEDYVMSARKEISTNNRRPPFVDGPNDRNQRHICLKWQLLGHKRGDVSGDGRSLIERVLVSRSEGNNERCSKKRPNFLNSTPTSKESVLQLLSTPRVTFWQQTAICPVLLRALVIELRPLNWARAQAVRLISDIEEIQEIR